MNFVLLFLITIFSLSLFFYGRSKTKSISIEKNIRLNALPKFYGYYLVLWCSIPALVFLLVWSLFEPVIIKSIIIETAVSIIIDLMITGSNNDQTNKNTNAGIEHHKTR